MSMQVIEHIEVGAGGAASMVFSSIPQTYTDLYLAIAARSDDANVPDYVNVRPNGSTSNLSYRLLRGSGSAAASFTVERNYITGALSTSNTFSNSSIYIANYASSNAKSWSSDSTAENNATEAYAGIMASLWNDTTAIASLELHLGSAGNFVQYSSATLYGITAGSDGVTSVS